MKSLIFFGGLQYSGKSHLAKELERSNPSKYKHIEIDGLCEYLVKRREVFMGLIKEYDRNLYKQIKDFGRPLNVRSDCDLLTLFANYMILEKRYDEFHKIQQLYILLYASKKIMGLNEEATPIIDGAFTNKLSRSIAYQTLEATFGKRTSLDKLKKLFVYFNLGLNLSLERFRKYKREEIKSLKWSEDLVERTFREQEIPTPYEFPNLEVIVINNSDELERTTNRLSNNV